MSAMQTAPGEVHTKPVTYSDVELTTALAALGVEKGDCLFIHSSLRSLGKFVSPRGDGPEGLFKAFIEIIGERGTFGGTDVQFRLLSGQAVRSAEYAIRKDGAFGEFLRCQPAALRSRHPFQSVSAIGSCAAEIAGAEGRSAFGKGALSTSCSSEDSRFCFLGWISSRRLFTLRKSEPASPIDFGKRSRAILLTEE